MNHGKAVECPKQGIKYLDSGFFLFDNGRLPGTRRKGKVQTVAKGDTPRPSFHGSQFEFCFWRSV
jgi:hypothetical protein